MPAQFLKMEIPTAETPIQNGPLSTRTGDAPTCVGCNRVFNTKGELQIHLITCIIPRRGVTFAHVWSEMEEGNRKRSEGANAAKTALPDSQVENKESDENADTKR